MKIEEEIKAKLELYEDIKARSSIFSMEYALAAGAVDALKWVLDT